MRERAFDAPDRTRGEEHAGLHGLANDALDARARRRAACDLDPEARAAADRLSRQPRGMVGDLPAAAVEAVEGQTPPVGVGGRGRLTVEGLDAQHAQRDVVAEARDSDVGRYATGKHAAAHAR